MSNPIREQHTKSPLIDRETAATYLGIRKQTLACWASNGRYHLPFVKVGRRVMYRLEDIERFIADNLITQGAAC
jgi:excisionase family DNA binding protein